MALIACFLAIKFCHHSPSKYCGQGISFCAVNAVSFAVKEKEILSVIGPNGAGKSTLFKLISSFLAPSAGEVRFRGERISNLAPHVAARKGVVRTFQETTIFRNMSVRDNVVIAHQLRSKASLFGYFAGSRQARADERAFGHSADEILAFLGLASISGEAARNLPHGHLRALGIAIGLATNPTVERGCGVIRSENSFSQDLSQSDRASGSATTPKLEV